MWKVARALTATVWHVKFLSKYYCVENRFFRCQLQVSISWKQPTTTTTTTCYMKCNVGSMTYTIVAKKMGLSCFGKVTIYYDIYIYNYHQCHIKVVIIKRHPDLSTHKDIWTTPHPVTQSCVTIPTLQVLPNPSSTHRHNWDEAQHIRS